MPPPPVYEEDEEEFEEPVAAAVEEVPAAPVRKPAQVIRRTPVHRSRPQREPLLQPLDEEPLVEPAYATAPTFGAREPAPVAAPEYQAQPRHAAPEPAYEEPVYEEPVRAAPVEKIWQDVYVINLMGRPGHDLQGPSCSLPCWRWASNLARWIFSTVTKIQTARVKCSSP